jgi:hypothetical protein
MASFCRTWTCTMRSGRWYMLEFWLEETETGVDGPSIL